MFNLDHQILIIYIYDLKNFHFIDSNSTRTKAYDKTNVGQGQTNIRHDKCRTGQTRPVARGGGCKGVGAPPFRLKGGAMTNLHPPPVPYKRNCFS